MILAYYILFAATNPLPMHGMQSDKTLKRVQQLLLCIDCWKSISIWHLCI